MPLLALNDNVVYVKGLRDRATGSFINDAVLEATLYDENQAALFDTGAATAISGADGITLDYKADSNGEYYAVIPATVQLTVGTDVLVRVVGSNYGIDRTRVVTVERG